jgi:hypothetical protein
MAVFLMPWPNVTPTLVVVHHGGRAGRPHRTARPWWYLIRLTLSSGTLRTMALLMGDDASALRTREPALRTLQHNGIRLL